MSRHKNQALGQPVVWRAHKNMSKVFGQLRNWRLALGFVFISSVQAWRVNMSKIFALTELDALFGLP